MVASRFPFLLDKSDGGGSGGAGGDPAKPFTDEQIAALGQVIAPIVNAAVTSHLKRQPNVADEIKKALTKDAIAPIFSELLNEVPDDDDPDAGSGGKGGSQPSKPDPKVSALEAKVQELTQKLTADAEERKKLVEESRNKDAKAALRAVLTPLVRADALEIAVRDLFDGQKRVTFDEQGNPLLTVRKPAFTGGSDEDVPMPLADGVQHWIKSSEGKFFAPAPGGNPGSGPTGGAPRRVSTGHDGMPKYDQPATTDAEKIRRAEEREAALRSKFPNL